MAGERSSLRSSKKIIITRFVHFPRERWLYIGLEKNNLTRNMLRLWVIYTLQSLGRSETPTQMSNENLGNEQLKIDMCLGNQTISIKSENQTAILKSYNQFKDHRWVILKIWDLWTPSAMGHRSKENWTSYPSWVSLSVGLAVFRGLVRVSLVLIEPKPDFIFFDIHFSTPVKWFNGPIMVILKIPQSIVSPSLIVRISGFSEDHFP